MNILSTVTNQDLMRQIEKLSSSQNHNLLSIILPPVIVGIVSILSVLISNYYSTKNTQKQLLAQKEALQQQLDAQETLLQKQLISQQNQMLITTQSNENLEREKYYQNEKLQNHNYINKFMIEELSKIPTEVDKVTNNYFTCFYDVIIGFYTTKKRPGFSIENLDNLSQLTMADYTKADAGRDSDISELQRIMVLCKEEYYQNYVDFINFIGSFAENDIIRYVNDFKENKLNPDEEINRLLKMREKIKDLGSQISLASWSQMKEIVEELKK